MLAVGGLCYLMLDTRGMEQFIKRDPTCVNRQKDDGFTPLHLASLNNHLDLVTVIAETVSTFIWSFVIFILALIECRLHLLMCLIV